MAELKDARCNRCFFWEKILGTSARPDHGGWCHRYPPIAGTPTAFPHTTARQWCGEYIAASAFEQGETP